MEKGFCLQMNGHGALLCKSELYEDDEKNKSEIAMAFSVFLELVEDIRMRYPQVVIHSLQYYSEKHKIILYYFTKGRGRISPLDYIEAEHTSLLELSKVKISHKITTTVAKLSNK